MRRTIWFSLACLICLAATVGLRALLLASKPSPKIPETFDTDASISLAVKTDKLFNPEEGRPAERVTVQTTKILPSSTKEEVVAPANLRPTYAEMRARSHHRHHRRHWRWPRKANSR
jgi:hypothetical protein